jgi:hypothetical protein
MMMSRLWKTLDSVAFKEIHDNLWLIEFSKESDKNKVKDGLEGLGYLIEVSSSSKKWRKVFLQRKWISPSLSYGFKCMKCLSLA